MFNNRRKIWPYVLGIFLLLTIIFFVTVYRALKNFSPVLFENAFLQNEIKRLAGEDKAPLINLAPELLGWSKPRTYLILFLNNTELRPGGGFIGVYAVMKVDKGKSEILKLQGTEILDSKRDKSKLLDPPPIIQKQLRVSKWYFRDSNWSPDFSESAKLALDFYRREDGLAAAEIDTVIGVTATVLEELLRVTGPITVDGIQFTSDNVIEKLEYQVEYGFREDGLEVKERKNIIEPMMRVVMARLSDNLLNNIKTYVEFVTRLSRERHIMAYSEDADLQNKFVAFDLAGTLKPDTFNSLTTIKQSDAVKPTDGVKPTAVNDYLLWADANMSALKTDRVMRRSLSYSLTQNADGRYEASASMEYKHTGKPDWRTSQYRTYARVYVPQGSQFIGVDGAKKWNMAPGASLHDQGSELGRSWFGAFSVIEPETTGKLTFHYLLPETFATTTLLGGYNLFTQKQLGTIATGLTLNLNFGTNITSAAPAEDPKKWHDARYELQTDLSQDKVFSVLLN